MTTRASLAWPYGNRAAALRKTVGVLVGVLVLVWVPVLACAQQTALLLFGGDGHHEFLGCLNCSEQSASSVWNEVSTYGFKNGFGIWNDFGDYKGEFSSYSACNQFATDPPVIVDRQGNFYGRFSVNEYAPQSVCGVTGAENVCMVVRALCAGQ